MGTSVLKALSFFLAFAPGASAAQYPQPGVFDSYVLAMSFEDDFCVAMPNKPECLNGSASSFGMALHGLWPNRNGDPKHTYQYCSPTTAKEVNRDWCSADYDVAGTMGQSVFEGLSQVMPGTQSCLYNHEWYAHGTCSGLSAADYFTDASELAARVIAMPNLQHLLTVSSGGTLTKAHLLGALVLDIGPKIEDAALLLCRKDAQTGQYFFSEVDIALDRQAFGYFPAASSLIAGRPQDGTCPDTGIGIVAPRSTR